MTSVTGAVLFDIDGTLVDSNYLHVHAWAEAFVGAGHPVESWRVHRGIGMGSGQLLEALLGPDSQRLGEQVKAAHSASYGRLAHLLRAFDGARALVRAVADRGAAAVLATSAAPEELARLRGVLDLDDVLHDIVGADDVDAAKPEPDLLDVALRKVGVGLERAVFVGDSIWDVEAANRAGVVCVGLLTGGTSAAELTAAGVVGVYSGPAQLLAELDASPLARAWRGA